MKQGPALISIGDLGLVSYLATQDIYPVDRTVDRGHASLRYEETTSLDAAMLGYQKSCSLCGFAPTELMRAQSKGRKMLLDGDLD